MNDQPNSETPRTDAAALETCGSSENDAGGGKALVTADFARTLERECSALAGKVAELKAVREGLLDSALEKIMTATDDQIKALCRLEGHDPDDEAKLTKQAIENALLRVERDRAQARAETMRSLLQGALNNIEKMHVCEADPRDVEICLTRIRAALDGQGRA